MNIICRESEVCGYELLSFFFKRLFLLPAQHEGEFYLQVSALTGLFGEMTHQRGSALTCTLQWINAAAEVAGVIPETFGGWLFETVSDQLHEKPLLSLQSFLIGLRGKCAGWRVREQKNRMK